MAALGSKQLEWHFGGSQTGLQTASHLGSSHFQEHSGWHFYDIDKQTINKKQKIFFMIMLL